MSLFSAVVDMHVCKHHVITKLTTIVYLTRRYPFGLGWLGFGQGRLSGVPLYTVLLQVSPSLIYS